jgi:hypothetical protein
MIPETQSMSVKEIVKRLGNVILFIGVLNEQGD